MAKLPVVIETISNRQHKHRQDRYYEYCVGSHFDGPYLA